MNARKHRGSLTVNNVAEMAEEAPELVIEFVQDIIDTPEMDIPDEAATIEDILKLQRLQAYYGNQEPYLIGLWGALRYAANAKNKKLIAMRDYLSRAISGCSKKYDAASRLLTGYEAMKDEGRKAKPW